MGIDQNKYVLLFKDIASIYVRMLLYYQISFVFDKPYLFSLIVLYK